MIDFQLKIKALLCFFHSTEQASMDSLPIEQNPLPIVWQGFPSKPHVRTQAQIDECRSQVFALTRMQQWTMERYMRKVTSARLQTCACTHKRMNAFAHGLFIGLFLSGPPNDGASQAESTELLVSVCRLSATSPSTNHDLNINKPLAPTIFVVVWLCHPRRLCSMGVLSAS